MPASPKASQSRLPRRARRQVGVAGMRTRTRCFVCPLLSPACLLAHKYRVVRQPFISMAPFSWLVLLLAYGSLWTSLHVSFRVLCLKHMCTFTCARPCGVSSAVCVPRELVRCSTQPRHPRSTYVVPRLPRVRSRGARLREGSNQVTTSPKGVVKPYHYGLRF